MSDRLAKMMRAETEDQDPADPLTWDDSYAIALALMQQNAKVDLEVVSLNMIYEWTINLPNFCDDQELANEQILKAIYLEWLEEANTS